jgi:hypothetical protein
LNEEEYASRAGRSLPQPGVNSSAQPFPGQQLTGLDHLDPGGPALFPAPRFAGVLQPEESSPNCLSARFHAVLQDQKVLICRYLGWTTGFEPATAWTTIRRISLMAADWCLTGLPRVCPELTVVVSGSGPDWAPFSSKRIPGSIGISELLNACCRAAGRVTSAADPFRVLLLARGESGEVRVATAATRPKQASTED